MGFANVNFGKVDRALGEVVFSDIEFEKEKFAKLKSLTVQFSLHRFILDSQNAFITTLDGLNLSGSISEDNEIELWGFAKNDQVTMINALHSQQIYKLHFKNTRTDLFSKKFGGITLQYDLDMIFSKNHTIELTAFIKTSQKKLELNASLSGKIDAGGDINLNIKADHISFENDTVNLNRGHADLLYNYSEKSAGAKSTIEGDAFFTSARFHHIPLRNVQSEIKATNDNISAQLEGSTYGPEDIIWSATLEGNKRKKNLNLNITPMQFSKYISYFEDISVIEKLDTVPKTLNDAEIKSVIIDMIFNQDQPTRGSLVITTAQQGLTITSPFLIKSNEIISGRFEINPTKIKSDQDSAEQSAATLDIMLKGIFNLTPAKNNKKLKLSWDYTFYVEDGSLNYGTITLNQITGEITKPQYEKNNSKLSFSLPFKQHVKYNGDITLNLKKSQYDILEQLKLKLYGGEISTQGPLFEGNIALRENSLQLIDIDLSKYFKDAGFTDTEIYGQMGGRIPFVLNENSNTTFSVDVNGGIIQSQGTGIIKLPEDKIKAFFPNNNDESIMIRQILKNYHYEFFEIRLDGDLMGRTMMTLNSRGINPDLKSKKPVDIKIQIETRPTQLIRNLVKEN